MANKIIYAKSQESTTKQQNLRDKNRKNLPLDSEKLHLKQVNCAFKNFLKNKLR